MMLGSAATLLRHYSVDYYTRPRHSKNRGCPSEWTKTMVFVNDLRCICISISAHHSRFQLFFHLYAGTDEKHFERKRQSYRHFRQFPTVFLNNSVANIAKYIPN
ncbi:PREDICTED: uncharacterized protein LOC108753091 [Trachymyrmex septentrionalis]|uniref:uncharacterized protein LOC108753091 n=1 Tax=Trachymyrmex septentrionalis TaxID=34720 RepID=UPI00084F78BA|nr:PREDICTED: uncharacterized protein LOC108753091 [Trachymyrmex septentrionalis]